MKRQSGLDWLRLTALMAVMALHVSSSVWAEMPVGSGEWLFATLIRQTWAVPVLVMITGSLLLDPERQPDIPRRLRRIAGVYLPWSAVYQFYYLACRGVSDWKGALAGILTGAYHMWYLWMLAGLYLLTPLLRPIAKDRKLSRLFLGLHLGASCLTYFGPHLPWMGTAVKQVADMAHLDFLAGYVGLYLLGWHLKRWPPAKNRGWIGPVCYGICVCGNLMITLKIGVNSEYFTNYLAPTMLIAAGGIFLLFAKIHRPCPAWASRLSLQAYLAHALVNEAVVALVTKERLVARPLWMIPATVLVGLGSFGLAWILEEGRKRLWKSTS